jgi:hypothetical protein
MARFTVLLSLIPVVIAGDWVYRKLSNRAEHRWLMQLPLNLALGSALVAYTLLLTSLIALPYALRLTLGLVLLLALFHLFRSRLHYLRLKGSHFRWNRENQITLVLAVPFSLVVISTMVVAATTDSGFDGLVTWAFKGKVAFEAGGWPSSYFVEPLHQVTHQEYPLLIPSLQAWAYTFLDRVDERAVKVIFLVFYVGLLAMFYEGIRRYVSTPLRVLYTGLLGAFPYLASLAAVSGYVDIPFMLFLLGATIFMMRWLEAGDQEDLLLSAVLVALIVWIKREGAVYWGFNALVVVVYTLWVHRHSWPNDKKWRVLVGFFGPALIILLPWYAFLAYHHIPNSDFSSVTLATARANVDRLSAITGRLLAQYLSLTRWGLLWPIFTLVLVWSRLRLRQPPVLYLCLSAIVPVLLLASTFLFSAWEPFTLHLDLSLERLFLHVSPLAWYFVVTQTRDLDTWFGSITGMHQVDDNILKKDA